MKFNNGLFLSHDGGRLSSDSGFILVDELIDTLHFDDYSKQLVSFTENRLF